MKKLKGVEVTLKDYRKIAVLLFPNAVDFLDKKIAEAQQGEDEEVLAAESQMLYLLNSINEKG
jgi:hypothetical protein